MESVEKRLMEAAPRGDVVATSTLARRRSSIEPDDASQLHPQTP